MSEYFPEPNSSGGKVKVELDLSNYAIKADSNLLFYTIWYIKFC